MFDDDEGNGTPTPARPRKRRQLTYAERQARKEKAIARYAALPPHDQYVRAYNWAIEYLGAAMRTKHQVRVRLLDRSVPPEIADAVVAKLTEQQYLDDAVFAGAWITSRQRGKGLSAQAIRRELAERGVDQDLIDSATAHLDDQTDEDQATEIAARKAARMDLSDPQRAIRRLVGMLARKGYGPAVAYPVARAAVEEARDS
jgi:regulatory protein